MQKYYPNRFGKLALLLVLLCLVWILAKKHSHGKPVHHIPYAKNNWAIGIMTGRSPLKLKPFGHNPVLTPEDVTDIDARYVADPFLIKARNTWYIFFEVMNGSNHRGEIAYATSRDGLHWKYGRRVLYAPFHLSFPYIFEHNHQFYMIPESRQAHGIRLYRATQFPDKWKLEKVLVKGDYVDPSIIRYRGKWWIFAAAVPRKKALHLFYSNDLLGPYTEHAKKPIVFGDKHITRPGGRLTVINGKLMRFAQDDDPTYGISVRAIEILRLTPKLYAEKEIASSPILKGSGSGWNAARMHTFAPCRLRDGSWIASVDGAPW